MSIIAVFTSFGVTGGNYKVTVSFIVIQNTYLTSSLKQNLSPLQYEKQGRNTLTVSNKGMWLCSIQLRKGEKVIERSKYCLHTTIS